MVFASLIRFTRNQKGGFRGPDRFWKRRKILRHSAHFYGRKRNCYSIAIRYVHRAWQYVTASRKLRREGLQILYEERLNAACMEHGLNATEFKKSLHKMDVLLNRRTLSDLAIFEPRTFKSLANLIKSVHENDGLNGINTLSSSPPPGVITRAQLKDL